MDASCFCCQFSLNTAGIIIGVYEIVQYTLLFFFALHFFKGKMTRSCMSIVNSSVRIPVPISHEMTSLISFSFTLLTFDPNILTNINLNTFSDDSDFLTIVTCCLCALIITSALLVYGSFKVTTSTCQSLVDILLSCRWVD